MLHDDDDIVSSNMFQWFYAHWIFVLREIRMAQTTNVMHTYESKQNKAMHRYDV